MSYCAPLGIPLSVFRSWPDGDRRWALAWRYDQDSRLGCGCHPDETTGVENDDAFTAVPRVCHRHRAIGDAAKARSQDVDENGDPRNNPHGVLWMTVRD